MKKWWMASANQDDLEDFSELFPEINRIYLQQKGNTAHEAVLKGFYLSRLALQRAFQEAEIHLPWTAFSWQRPGILANTADFCVSLSHTENNAVAVVASRNHYQSIGVDVERADRPMKTGSERFFINEYDDSSRNMLEMWTIKEAAFKAYSPLYPELALMKPIKISAQKTHYAQVEGDISIFHGPLITTVVTIKK